MSIINYKNTKLLQVVGKAIFSKFGNNGTEESSKKELSPVPRHEHSQAVFYVFKFLAQSSAVRMVAR